MGVTTAPPTTGLSSSSRMEKFSLPEMRRRGVRGPLEVGVPFSSITLRAGVAIAVAASLSWLIWASWRALRPRDRCSFSWASSFSGILVGRETLVSYKQGRKIRERRDKTFNLQFAIQAKKEETYLRPGDLSGDGTAGPLLMLRRGPVLRRGILAVLMKLSQDVKLQAAAV